MGMQTYEHDRSYHLFSDGQEFRVLAVAFVRGDAEFGTAFLAVSESEIVTAYVPPDSLDVEHVETYANADMKDAYADFTHRLSIDYL